MNLATQSARSSLADRKDDLYETPEEATRALLANESVPHNIWEPACGPGAIVRVLRAAGHDVWATDLVQYEGGVGISGIDFLMEQSSPPNCDAIVMNPPYKLADQFVRHALTLCPKVVALLRFAFCESKGRSDILDGGQLARVHLFRDRLTMHRASWTGPKVDGGAIPFAWFVWDRNHVGAPVLNRISWRDYMEAAE